MKEGFKETCIEFVYQIFRITSYRSSEIEKLSILMKQCIKTTLLKIQDKTIHVPTFF
jgi:hypothetical protein